MASQKEYAYSIKGNKLNLLEKDYSGGETGLNYTYSKGLDLPKGVGSWKSPLSDVTNGIEIEYTSSSSSSIVDESSDLPVSDYLAKALVYYIKARLSEGEKDFQTREYYMKQFYKCIEKNNNAKIYGARRISPGNHRIK